MSSLHGVGIEEFLCVNTEMSSLHGVGIEEFLCLDTEMSSLHRVGIKEFLCVNYKDVLTSWGWNRGVSLC